MKKYAVQMTLLLTGTILSTAHALDVYVSPDGSDAGNGTLEQPLASLTAAQKKVRSVAGKEPVTVHLADGIYYLPETLVFIPGDSGSKKHPVIYQAENEGGAVLSGGSKLDLQWKPYKDGIFQAKTPAGLTIDQLFINGENQRMARYPNYDASKKTEAYQGYAADAFSQERAAGWQNPEGGYIHAMHAKEWGGYHYLITGKDAKGEVTCEGGWQNNRQLGMHKQYRMVENIFEELDAPGEWFHNAKKSLLYYKPAPDGDLAAAKVEVVRLRHLIEFQGSEKKPVEFVTLQGFVVRHAARTFMDCKEPMLRSDWAIYRGGAFMLTGTEDVQILDCEFDQVGGNAIFVNNYNRRTLVKGCHIHDAGASGVCFIGDPNAVRNPLFEYGEKNDLATIDRTPGPKTQNFPSLGTVEDCLIHGIGRVERQPAGVTMDMASEITVRDCSVYDCARSGINIGDGAWGGHLIERCDVFDTVLETHDHGSFNSWGRDRFWHSDRKASQAVIDKEPDLPFLDAVKTTTIRDSRWRCDHGWDIDLDDGSSNYDIYNNLMLSGGLKLREGFRRHAWNNITVNNSFHPHVWYNNSGDEVYANIFMGTYRGVRVPSANATGKRVDSNLIFGGVLTQKFGWDENSIVGDPLFVDPANGDFRVKDGSPALKLGFENFPMDQFGVKKPSLKAMARTPVIPALNLSPEKKKGGGSAKKWTWLGANLSLLSGEDFSAYGVSKEDGGVALSGVKKGSPAAKAGLKDGDLILAINGRKVGNAKQLNRAVARAKGTVALNVVRNQQEIELKVTVSPAGSKPAAERASNPFVKHMFTADPSAHVLEDGRLYVYPSTDIKGKGYKSMDGYHVFSTDDMITWTDHGQILHSRDVEWGWKQGGYMWAPDCVYKDGIYYFYFPHKNAQEVWEIGVATSTKPASDYKVQGFVKGGTTFCDPCVFIDDDGQAYLYAVVHAKTYAARLKDNMMEIEGEMVLQSVLEGHREGPFVFKRKGIYYLIYPDNTKGGHQMRYAMSSNPLGPWESKGVFLEKTSALTTHGSIVEYKGQWYLFYHNADLSGGKKGNRSICFDTVSFNEDGTINMVEPTPSVVP